MNNNENKELVSQNSIKTFTLSDFFKSESYSEDMKNFFLYAPCKIYSIIYKSECSIYNYITNSKIVKIPKEIIFQSNENRIIYFNKGETDQLSDKTITITPIHRKLALLSLTSISIFLHYYYLIKKNKKFKYRLIVPYFMFYSLMIYREALNPYIH